MTLTALAQFPLPSSKLASLRSSRALLAGIRRGTIAASTRPSISTLLPTRGYHHPSKKRKESFSAPKPTPRTARQPKTNHPSPPPKREDLPLLSFDPSGLPHRDLYKSSTGHCLLPLPQSCLASGQQYLVYHPETYKKRQRLGSRAPPPAGNWPMKIHLSVVTTPTADTPGTSVLIHFPERRYLLGQVSEGTQRAFIERGVRSNYLSDVFITGRTTWQNTGGLIGLILTQADGLSTANSAAAAKNNGSKESPPKQKEKRPRKSDAENTATEKESPGNDAQSAEKAGQVGTLRVHGAPNLSHTLATARRFVFRKGMPVFINEYDSESSLKKHSSGAADPFEEPSWSDGYLKVWSMPISPSSSPRGNLSSDSQRPRKRSHEEFQEKNEPQTQPDDRTAAQIKTQSIITDMFNSEWRMDALFETKLADAKMPAMLWVRNPETKSLEPYKGPIPGGKEPLPDINVFMRRPWPGATVENLPTTSWSDEAVSYIVRNHDIRGKFDPKKAAELKVRPGPKYSELARGETVLSEDNKEITSDMVLGPSRVGKGLAVIDLPTPEYVDGLVNRPEWKSPSATANLQTFIWILGPGVGEHPKLREFVASMPHCKHMVSGADYCPDYLAMASAATTTANMAQILPDNYIVPKHDNVVLPQPGTRSSFSEELIKSSPFEPLEPGLILDMEPKFEFNRSEVASPLDVSTTLTGIPFAVKKRLWKINKNLNEQQFQEDLQKFREGLPGTANDAEIITLGTGSSSPSKYRNVSSTLLKVPGYGYYMFDCGENTLGQLKRVFSPEELKEVLQNLRMIWISHLHADHHLGTASVVKAWFQENYPDGISLTNDVEQDLEKILKEKRLFVIGEEHMMMWLQEYAAVDNYGFGKLVPLSVYQAPGEDIKLTYRHCRANGSYPNHENDPKPPSTTFSFPNEDSPFPNLLYKAIGLSNILTARVHHCRGAMAVSLEFPDGFKVSYSGDCRPSQWFAEIGKGSTVLIHEATFGDNMAGSAKAKKHSTTSEALEVARRMDARAVVLTHLSQRYSKVSNISTDSRANAQNNKAEEEVEPPPPENPDIPEEDDAETQPAAANIRDPIEVKECPRLSAPIVAASDYMRFRVADMPITQAYEPATSKLQTIYERQNAEQAEGRRAYHEKQNMIRSWQKIVKRDELYKMRQRRREAKEAEQEAGPESESESASASAPKNHSAWSASESESGWSTSEGEESFKSAGGMR